MVSYFSRVNYALKDRYLLSVSLRTDGSSKFGKDNKWGWFPSVSAGWRISEESFIKERAKWLNQLKLRLSYGVTGTDAIESYANTDLLDSAGYILGEGNGSVVSGLANNSASLGNRALQWEQTNQANFGLDISLLNNRIGLTFDYYYSITKSLLYQKTVNSIAGYTQAWTNEGKLRNRGFEMHDSWFTERTELARKNQLIMRKLGMQPVLQGYSGMVPVDITDKDPSAQVIKQGTWCSFQRPSMLKTDSETFDKYAQLFYKVQKEVYGDVSDYYATDPFHEGGNTGGMSPTVIAEKVLANMMEADENGIWIIQSWQGNPSTALLQAASSTAAMSTAAAHRRPTSKSRNQLLNRCCNR